MGRPSKLTAATTAAICDVIAAGGTRSIAARAAGVHPDTLNGWLRRAAQEDTETTLEADDYTLRELRALAKTAHIPGYGRLRKADLATAIAAKPSEYSVFSAALKKAEAEAQAARPPLNLANFHVASVHSIPVPLDIVVTSRFMRASAFVGCDGFVCRAAILTRTMATVLRQRLMILVNNLPRLLVHHHLFVEIVLAIDKALLRIQRPEDCERSEPDTPSATGRFAPGH